MSLGRESVCSEQPSLCGTLGQIKTMEKGICLCRKGTTALLVLSQAGLGPDGSELVKPAKEKMPRVNRSAQLGSVHGAEEGSLPSSWDPVALQGSLPLESTEVLAWPGLTWLKTSRVCNRRDVRRRLSTSAGF